MKFSKCHFSTTQGFAISRILQCKIKICTINLFLGAPVDYIFVSLANILINISNCKFLGYLLRELLDKIKFMSSTIDRRGPTSCLLHQLNKDLPTNLHYVACNLTSNTIHWTVHSFLKKKRNNWCILEGPISVVHSHGKPHHTVNHLQYILERGETTANYIETHLPPREQSS